MVLNYVCFRGFPNTFCLLIIPLAFHWEAKVLEINAKQKAKKFEDPDSENENADTCSDQDRVSPAMQF